MIGEIVNLVSREAPYSSETSERMEELLEEAGIRIVSIRRIEPEGQIFEQTISESARLFDLVLILDAMPQGGDKILRKVLSQVSGKGLVLVEGLLEDLRSYYQDKGMTTPKDLETRALLPKDAHWIPPVSGVRAGTWMGVKGKYLMVLPDDLYEVEQMWERTIFPWLTKLRGAEFYRRSLTADFVSRVPAKVKSSIQDLAHGCQLTFFSEGCYCKVTMIIEGRDPQRLENQLARLEAKIKETYIQEYLGEGQERLEELVGRLLIEGSHRIAIAESCTGGMITACLVEIPGISTVLDRGVVTYSNESKTSLLGVDEDVFITHGAVSRVTARSMAEGVRKGSGVEIGLAVTGIAGPGGGTPEKPVGTVFIGLSTPDGNEVMEYHFQGDRKEIRLQSTQMALDRVRRYLLKI